MFVFCVFKMFIYVDGNEVSYFKRFVLIFSLWFGIIVDNEDI